MSIHPIERSFFKEPQSQLGSLRFFCTLSSIFGILPFNNDENNFFVRAYSIVIVCSMVLLEAVLSTLFLTFSASSRSLTFPLLFITREILQILLWIVQFVCISVYRDRFKRLVKSVRELSVGMKSLQFPTYKTAAGFVFFPLYIIGQGLLEDSNEIGSWFIYRGVVKIINELGIYLVLMQFCTFLEVIEKRLDHITLILGESTALESFTEKHHQLVRSASSVNDLYSWQLLIICTMNFINFVSWLFYAMQNVLVDNEVRALPYELSYCAWQLLNIYFMAGSCEKLVEKAEDFNAELFRLMRESNVYCNNQKLYLYVTMKQSVNFTACGFFSLGYPLVTSIISSATTYLVILVQFSMPSP